jgi:uncharacterized ferritin-like protein (DUF455 family)
VIAERLVHHIVHQAFLIRRVQKPLLRLAQFPDQPANFLPHHVRRQRLEVLHVQAIHQLLVDAHLHLLKVNLALAAHRRDRRLHHRRPRPGCAASRRCHRSHWRRFGNDRRHRRRRLNRLSRHRRT